MGRGKILIILFMYPRRLIPNDALHAEQLRAIKRQTVFFISSISQENNMIIKKVKQMYVGNYSNGNWLLSPCACVCV